MKKLFLTLAISAVTLFGSAQSFQYEAKKITAPIISSWSADSMEVTYICVITVGIIGEPYGFVAPSTLEAKNSVYFTLSAKEAKSPDVLQKYAWSKADEWVKQNYPDIK